MCLWTWANFNWFGFPKLSAVKSHSNDFALPLHSLHNAYNCLLLLKCNLPLLNSAHLWRILLQNAALYEIPPFNWPSLTSLIPWFFLERQYSHCAVCCTTKNNSLAHHDNRCVYNNLFILISLSAALLYLVLFSVIEVCRETVTVSEKYSRNSLYCHQQNTPKPRFMTISVFRWSTVVAVSQNVVRSAMPSLKKLVVATESHPFTRFPWGFWNGSAGVCDWKLPNRS